MNTKLLGEKTLSMIDQYKNFTVGKATCSIPYFNNKTIRARGGLRVYGGKGSPKDIYDELLARLTKDHVEVAVMTNENLKQYLTDKNIGIDCSGLTYYILDAESHERGLGQLDKHLRFTKCKGIFGKIRCALRPVENCDVKTFVDDKNSKVISLDTVTPGDFIALIGDPTDTNSGSDRNHILVIHQIEYQNFIPTRIHYTHTIAYPEDGVYGTGIKQGSIEILDLQKNIADNLWIEDGQSPESLKNKVRKSQVEIRRLLWF